MTEIPEHLLARSKAAPAGPRPGRGRRAPRPTRRPPAPRSRRPPPAAPPAPAPPAVAAASPGQGARAPAAAPPPPPPRPEVVAALSPQEDPVVGRARRRRPAGLGGPSTPSPSSRRPQASPLARRRAPSSTRAPAAPAATAPTGGGGVGPAFADGAVVETFPNSEDHVEWVDARHRRAGGRGGRPTATPDKPVGGSGNVMPGFGGTLTEEEILLVVRYEREVLAGHGCEPELAEAHRRGVRAGEPKPPAGSPVTERHDVLVVGGGPAGAATAYWLARPATTSSSSSARRSRGRRPAATG